jgi:hypothetical protein
VCAQGDECSGGNDDSALKGEAARSTQRGVLWLCSGGLLDH